MKEEQQIQNGNGLYDRIIFDRNLVNICVSVSLNGQINIGSPEEPRPLPDTCGGCFSVLSIKEKQAVISEANKAIPLPTPLQSIVDLCNLLETSTQPKTELGSLIDNILDDAGISSLDKDFILACLENLGLILGPE